MVDGTVWHQTLLHTVRSHARKCCSPNVDSLVGCLLLADTYLSTILRLLWADPYCCTNSAKLSSIIILQISWAIRSVVKKIQTYEECFDLKPQMNACQVQISWNPHLENSQVNQAGTLRDARVEVHRLDEERPQMASSDDDRQEENLHHDQRKRRGWGKSLR